MVDSGDTFATLYRRLSASCSAFLNRCRSANTGIIRHGRVRGRTDGGLERAEDYAVMAEGMTGWQEEEGNETG